jgi:hypothetical protein
LRLVEAGYSARGPASRLNASWRVQIIDQSGEMLDEVQTDTWTRAVEVFDSFVAGGAA